jgi:transcriptional regulator with GAF, ATPase, and Fis domain
MKSGIYIPLVINNKCIGVISFQTFKDDISFEEEKNFFEKIAPYIALVVEKLYYI